MPQHEARSAVASGAPVFLSINPVEYHGPHLPLRTDALISAHLNRGLFERLREHQPEWPFLDGGELEVGVEPTPGPGTRSVPYRIVRDAVLRACRSLVALGARRVVLMTFHGAPLHSLALDAGVRWLTRQGVPALAPLNIAIALMMAQTEGQEELEASVSPIEDPEVRQAVLEELRMDFHAGFFETSLLMHFEPEAVSARHAELLPCPPVRPHKGVLWLSELARRAGRKSLSKELAFAATGLGWHALRPFPGYTGRPDLANRRSGAIFAEALLTRYAQAAQATLLKGAPPPAPSMRWLLPLSLGGRLPQPSIPDRDIAASLDA